MSAKTHTYVCNKGYAPEYKGRKVTWTIHTTPDEAIAAGDFDSLDTIMRYANAQLNIKRGHAIQKATLEQTKDADGKPTGTLANPNMTTAAMEQLAAATNATATERTRTGEGKQKDRAKAYDTTKEKAKQILETATPEKLATLLELGFISKEEHDAKLAAISGGGQSRRAARQS